MAELTDEQVMAWYDRQLRPLHIRQLWRDWWRMVRLIHRGPAEPRGKSRQWRTPTGHRPGRPTWLNIRGPKMILFLIYELLMWLVTLNAWGWFE